VRLGPGDTKTVLASFFVFAGPGQGFAYAFAKRPHGQAISFNHLMGGVLVLDSLASSEYSIPALAFGGVQAYLAPTDLDLDGVRDLNGLEYEEAPADLMFPSFLGQTASWGSELVLLGLTGGRQFTSRVRAVVRNDDEETFTATLTFRGWKRAALGSFSALFSNDFLSLTHHDPAEKVLGVETGWFSLHGLDAKSSARTILDPAVLAVLIEPREASSATLPFATGGQANGDFWPSALLGDPLE
jgi:hypothetical protein